MNKKSSLIILTVVLIAIFTAGMLESFNFGKYKKKITGKTGLLKKAKRIKKNLEKDVKILWNDAKILIASKNQLIKLKDRITRELNSIANKLKKTERDIMTTKKHVSEIDDLMRGLK